MSERLEAAAEAFLAKLNPNVPWSAEALELQHALVEHNRDNRDPKAWLDALDQAAGCYRRQLKEILADCGHDKPNIDKIRERAEAAIRAADHALSVVAGGPGDTT